MLILYCYTIEYKKCNNRLGIVNIQPDEKTLLDCRMIFPITNLMNTGPHSQYIKAMHSVTQLQCIMAFSQNQKLL